MAKIKSNAHLWLSPFAAAAPASVAITSATKAKPVVVTPATMPVGLASGDFVAVDGTGEVLLDGYTFRTANKTATTFELVDVDGTKLTAAVAAKGTVTPYLKAGTGAMLEACMAQITVTGQAPDSLNLDDMCSTQTILGDNKPPAFTFSGFVDKDSPGFSNLIEASLASPKPTVEILIDFGTTGGFIAGPGQIGEVSVTSGVGQGLGFSGAGIFTKVPTYSWAL
jgi:hypothetical protein